MFQMMALAGKYVYLALIVLFTAMGFYLYLRKPSASVCREVYSYQAVFIVLFNVMSYVLIIMNAWNASKTSQAALEAAREGQSLSQFLSPLMSHLPGWFTESMLVTLGLYALIMIFMYILLATVYKHTNRLLWNCVYMLLSISFVVLYRLDPDVCRRQIYWMALGFAVSCIVMLFFKGHWIWKIPSWFFLGLSLALIALPFIFPSPAYGALNWVEIGPVSFQPSEFVKLTFAFFLAIVYTWDKKFRAVAYAGTVTIVLALILLKQNDLGGLLIFGILAWMMTYDYIGKAYVLWIGMALVAAAGFAAYKLVSHVAVRFDIWMDPWKDVNGQGYQIAQSLFAIVNGGWFGLGLYQGYPEYIPVRSTDMIFSVIANEFGTIFAMVLVMIYLLMFLFVMETGSRERNTIRRNLLIAFGVLFILQTFIIVGGVIKLIPLTGVTLPFVSYGGSSLLSNFITIAIIEAVILLYRKDKEEVRQYERERQLQQRAQWQAQQAERRTAGLAAGRAGAQYSNSQQAGAARQQPAPDASGKQTSKRRKKGQGQLKPFDFDDPF